MATEGQQQGSQVVVQVTSRAPSMPLRIIWFVFIGWWLAGIAIFFAWLFNVLIVTMPLGLYILNRLPQVATLRQASRHWQSNVEGGVTVIREVDIEQRTFWKRALYFVLTGWWFSLIWLYLAWLIQWTIILIPLTFLMYSKSAAVTTLRKT